ncbi:MAG: alcohol dehydrogenase catalytic domain-containing protein [Lentisphaerae bacterium]|nr:alcohol dehydrogenase catalytic domain-containing protein [Lentisphaerota bacterium]
MPKSIIIERIGEISWREMTLEDDYQPTRQEEIDHGTRVVTRHFGEPGPDEIETRAVCGAICTHEVSLFKGDLTHPRYPMIPGHEAVHQVMRVGKNIRHLKEGDFCAACWYMGQWAQKVIGPADVAHKLPDDMDDFANWIIEPAASIVNAGQYMNIKPGMRVLLIGAGFMGLLMTQMVHRYPLSEFVVADVKPFSADMAKRCGAYEALLVNTDAGKGRLSDMGTGHFDAVIECSGTQNGLDLAVDMCGMAGSVYLFGWHRTSRTLDFKLGHLRGQTLVHTSPATDTGRLYERYWPTTIALFQQGIFDMSKLVTHKYRAEDIQKCMDDSVARPDGFIKSVFYL